MSRPRPVLGLRSSNAPPAHRSTPTSTPVQVEYLLYKGKMEVRGGDDEGGTTAIAPSYGFEPSGARA